MKRYSVARDIWRNRDYKAIPILINARDLVVPLRRLIVWLLEAGYTRIYVLDNDSSYPPLLDFYDKMKSDIQVLSLGANVGHTAIWDLNILDRLNITGPYVWSDPDVVPIEECPPHVLEFFLDVLRAYPTKTKIGFGLKIDDLPDYYRHKQSVLSWEAQFWKNRITSKLYDAFIDTTFALYRPGSGYDLSAIRSGFPYLARHWPWYENTGIPSDDQVYYLANAKPGLNNWAGDRIPASLAAKIEQLNQ